MNKEYKWTRKGKQYAWKEQSKELSQYESANYKTVYATIRWRELRDRFIKKHPLCIVCKNKGTIKAAQCVDHIKAIQDGGDAWDERNLQSLCNRCHKIKTNQEINERKRTHRGLSKS